MEIPSIVIESMANPQTAYNVLVHCKTQQEELNQCLAVGNDWMTVVEYIKNQCGDAADFLCHDHWLNIIVKIKEAIK